MKGIEGQLSSLPLTDLMQWIEMNRKSGVLLLSDNESSRCVCFKDGFLMLASSNEGGGRFGEHLAREAHTDVDKINEAVISCRQKGEPFITHLIESNVVSAEFMRAVIEHQAESVLMDILSWKDGLFQFIDKLPAIISDSPIKIDTNHLVFESVRKYDEAHKKEGQ